MKEQISPKDWILLSSYLDDELNPLEKTRVETRLKTQPAFLKALESLRRTKAVLRSAPARRIPRNFTLPAAMARPKARTLQLIPVLRWASVAVAVVSVILMAGTLLTGVFRGTQMAAAPAPMLAKEATTMEAGAPQAEQPQESLQATPPVIYWNGPPAPQGYGMGGGGDGGISPPLDTAGGYAGSSIAMATQAPELQKIQPTTQPTAEATESPRAFDQSLTGSGPILGVAPTDQQGQVIADNQRQALPLVASADTRQTNRYGAAVPLMLIIAAALVLVAVGLFVTAWVLRRKNR